MPEKRTERCDCCDLPFFATLTHRTDTVATDYSVNQNRRRRSLCPECRLHQGDAPEQRLKRYEADQPKLREAMQAAATYAVRKEREIRAAQEQTRSALSSRDRIAQTLRAVQDLHSMRGDGSCSCGIKKNCRTADALYGDRWVERMIRRQDENFERRQRWMEGNRSTDEGTRDSG